MLTIFQGEAESQKGSPRTPFTQQEKETEMLAFVSKKKKSIKICKFCIRIQFLRYLYCCLGLYLLSTIPQIGIFSKLLHRLSLLAKDVQNSGKRFLGSDQRWVLHRSRRMIFHPDVISPILQGFRLDHRCSRAVLCTGECSDSFFYPHPLPGCWTQPWTELLTQSVFPTLNYFWYYSHASFLTLLCISMLHVQASLGFQRVSMISSLPM